MAGHLFPSKQAGCSHTSRGQSLLFSKQLPWEHRSAPIRELCTPLCAHSLLLHSWASWVLYFIGSRDCVPLRTSHLDLITFSAFSKVQSGESLLSLHQAKALLWEWEGEWEQRRPSDRKWGLLQLVSVSGALPVLFCCSPQPGEVSSSHQWVWHFT